MFLPHNINELDTLQAELLANKWDFWALFISVITLTCDNDSFAKTGNGNDKGVSAIAILEDFDHQRVLPEDCLHVASNDIIRRNKY